MCQRQKSIAQPFAAAAGARTVDERRDHAARSTPCGRSARERGRAAGRADSATRARVVSERARSAQHGARQVPQAREPAGVLLARLRLCCADAHGAQKSTSTGTGDLRTTASNVSAVTATAAQRASARPKRERQRGRTGVGRLQARGCCFARGGSSAEARASTRHHARRRGHRRHQAPRRHSVACV